jgi:hypothetical protein
MMLATKITMGMVAVVRAKLSLWMLARCALRANTKMATTTS